MITVKLNTDGMRDFVRNVMQRAEKARERVLKKNGAYVRVVAKNSLKDVGKRERRYSQAGQPPFSRIGSLKHMILFAYDPRSRSVVVGPALTRSGSLVPRILERGGTETIRGRGGKTKAARYAARPFMNPALVKSLKKIAEHWKDSIY